MTEITIVLDGETEHQFKYLLENTRYKEGEETREPEPEELAQELLTSAVMDNYIQAIQNGQPR